MELAPEMLTVTEEAPPSRVAGLFQSLVSRREAKAPATESREALRRFLCPSEKAAPAPTDAAPVVHDDPQRKAAFDLVRRLRITAR